MRGFAAPFHPNFETQTQIKVAAIAHQASDILQGTESSQSHSIQERVLSKPFQTPPISPNFPGHRSILDAPISTGHRPILNARLQVPVDQSHRIMSLLSNIPKPTKFIPSNMVLERGMAPAPNVGLVIQSNGQYLGNKDSKSNKLQVPNLSDDLNCALFLRNIPANTSIADFFDSINTGAVYSLHIMPPNGQYATCAAKLTFMTSEAAAQFLAKIQVGIWFDGHWLEGVYNNREGHLRNTMAFSRVIFVEGPGPMMTVDYWFRYFRQVSIFQWDRVLEHGSLKPGYKCLEFRFARVNGQAQTCIQQIQNQEEFEGLVTAWYGFDPCDQLPL